MQNLHLRKSRDRIRHAVYAFEETPFLQDRVNDIYANVPDRLKAVVGMNWRQEAPADFRATLMPPAEYKIHSKENDGYIKMMSWSPYMEAFTAEIPRKGSANILKKYVTVETKTKY
ncbi:hypothetical protein PoB_005827600 [Plakobranchus ocellatus]|uniref:Uncharacterized protein n=1 Tax=Plakobranchus ocellatus TaxID=259542 RepID=A0AAV4CJS7_9GAST|nr:hypothetical protein PoB_005827600 [Plakobranchus ocellatus]